MAREGYTSVNGIEPSWSDIKIQISVTDGSDIDDADIEGVKFTEKLTLGMRRGTSGGRKQARSSGEADFDGSITFAKSALRLFKAKLAEVAKAKGYVRGSQAIIGLVEFDIVVQHTPPGETNIYTSVLKGCRYIGSTHDLKAGGTDIHTVEVPLDINEIAELDEQGNEIVIR